MILAIDINWYNYKYERCGHLFQERFKSEVVESDAYFLTVLRYIHQNPVKAGLVKKVDEYRWSSYKEYIRKATWLDIDFALEMFSGDRFKSVQQFEIFMNKLNADKCLDYEEKLRIPDRDIRLYLSEKGIMDTSELQHLEKTKRDEMLKSLKSIEGVTIRQLSRITGISKSVIDRV